MTQSDQSVIDRPPVRPLNHQKKWLGLREYNGLLQEWEMTGWGVCASIAAGVLATLLVIGLITSVISSNQCSTVGQRYGLPSHWTVLYGCFLRLPNHHWILSGQYHVYQPFHR